MTFFEKKEQKLLKVIKKQFGSVLYLSYFPHD
jgi:hypothetical protein